MDTEVKTKQCSKCKCVYPLTSEYWQRASTKDGFHCWCKPCKQADARRYNRPYYETHREEIIEKTRLHALAHPEKQRARHQKWYKAHKELSNTRVRMNARKVRLDVLEHYGGKCVCCGEDRTEFLAIDHIKGGGRKHRQSIPGNNLYRWLRNNEYPEGFRVLCHNCNMAIGFYGYCPHGNLTPRS